MASGDHMVVITPVWCEREWHTSFPGILPSLPLHQTLVCFPGSHVTFRTSWFFLATFSEESAPSAPSLYLLISSPFVLLSSRPQHSSLLSHSLERDPCCLLPGVRTIYSLYIHYRIYINVKSLFLWIKVQFEFAELCGNFMFRFEKTDKLFSQNEHHSLHALQ